MISIICPFYNSQIYLNRTIDSLLKQEGINFPIEIIFIDDGSTDMSNVIIKNGIKKLNDKKFSPILLKQKNKGPGAARNYGISKAKYQYIAFLDADDIWSKNKLSICKKAIDDNKDYFNLFIHDENYIRFNKNNDIIIHGVFDDANIMKSLYKKNNLSTSAVIVKKEVLMKCNGFDESLQSSQDYDLWLKASPYLKIYKINQVLGDYHETLGSITSKYYIFRFLDQLRIAIRYKSYVNKLFFVKKILKILFSKQWVFGLINRGNHNY